MTDLATLAASRPRCEMSAELSSDIIEEFKERGFVSIDRLVPEEELDWIREVYGLLMAGAVPGTTLIRDVMTRVDEQRGDRVSQVIKPELVAPFLKETLFWRNGRRLAATLLQADEDKLEGWGHMIQKAPRDTETLAWHQDEGFWDPHFDYKALAVWMALDPATTENGCVSFVPGSHRQGVLEHALGNDDPAVTYLELHGIDESLAHPQPVPAGGAVIHHCRTIHKSGPNRSDGLRRAYINEWQLPPTQRAEPYDRPWWHARQKAMTELSAATRV